MLYRFLNKCKRNKRGDETQVEEDEYKEFREEKELPEGVFIKVREEYFFHYEDPALKNSIIVPLEHIIGFSLDNWFGDTDVRTIEIRLKGDSVGGLTTHGHHVYMQKLFKLIVEEWTEIYPEQKFQYLEEGSDDSAY